jgi:hypothetical protein
VLPDGPALAVIELPGRGLHPHRGLFWPTYTRVLDLEKLISLSQV